MSYAQQGLLVLAAALLFSNKLELDFRRAQYATIAALTAFLTVLVLDGLLVIDREKEYLVLMHIASVVGWLMLIVALIRACNAFRVREGCPADRSNEESADQEREQVRQEIREQFAERDRESEGSDRGGV